MYEGMEFILVDLSRPDEWIVSLASETAMEGNELVQNKV